MGSALLNTPVLDFPAGDSAELAEAEVPAPASDSCSATDSAETLRRLAAERLATHRGRRQRLDPAAAAPSEAASHDPRTSRIAATVAARYANSISYRAYLAAEAERAVQEAQAAAEIARLNAEAIVEAQQRLLEDLDKLTRAQEAESSLFAEPASAAFDPTPIAVASQDCSLWPKELYSDEKSGHEDLSETEPQDSLHVALHQAPRRSITPPQPQSKAKASTREPRLARTSFETDLFAPAPERAIPSASAYTVRLGGEALPASLRSESAPRIVAESDVETARALDEEISFRRTPVFEAPPEPAVPLSANLIEFPRQLVASRKARPRIAEGPLREELDASPFGGQLRIFEVEPAQISATPSAGPAAEPSAELQWSSILLEGAARAGSFAARASSSHPQPQPAPLGRRAFSAAVDLAVVTSALAGSALALAVLLLHRTAGASVVSALGQLPGVVLDLLRSPERTLAIASVLVGFVLLWVVYQLACFTFSDATFGMRFTRIGLCTLTDENPTRAEMRRRIPMVLLSVCALGLGFLWAALDEDSLTWHDLISRMYQRSY